ncbi:ABC transporter substrate-binding protein [Motilibacter sp. K478]|nr:ABC transporter substrate-binding protein [Motilibacter aurantiacus]NHC45763.1 ABC transporter substrate-binding protein [Motilibacter aurantiacus]
MRGLKVARLGVGLAALSLVVAGCGGGDDDDTSSPSSSGSASGGTTGGRVSIEISEPQYLVPTNTNETAGAEVLDALFVGLVDYDEQNKPVLTELAAAVDSSDNKTWDIKLNPGWTFHNGEPVTSDSFINAWNYGALNANGQNNNYFFGSIEGYSDLNPEDPNPDDEKVPEATAQALSGLKKVSDTEFTVTLTAPDNTFKTSLGYTAFYPMPEAAFGDIKAFEEAPIGNGPFKMNGSWNHKESIAVDTYADFKGTKPKVDGIDFKIYESLETAYNDLTAGNLDVMDSLPPSALANAEQELGDRYQTFPSSRYDFFGFPTYDQKYANIKVRQAISMAIDREAIATTVFNNTREPADAFVSPVVAGYQEGSCGEFCTFNPERAKQLLAEGGGLSDMTITYNADGGHKEWVTAACNQIQQTLGVQCVAEPKPSFDVLLDDLDKSKSSKQGFGPFRLGWIMDYPSMQNYLGPLYTTGGSSNYYGYSNPKFDDLVKKGQTEATEEAAIADWKQAESILAEEFPVIPLFFGVTNAANSERVTNVSVDAFDRIDKVNISLK